MTIATIDSQSLAVKVFHAIAQHFATKAIEIEKFVRSQYSFEEWLNWEAFTGCSVVPGWSVHAKPRYSELGIKDCRQLGDLMVISDARKVIVEIGLVHDGTYDKWRDKLECDVEKLARPLENTSALQIVVLASASDIETNPEWQDWLKSVPCWNRTTDLNVVSIFPYSGKLVVRGWT